jgi:hypothetical protein
MFKTTELQQIVDDTSAPRHDVAAFAAQLAQASPHQIIEVAARAMPDRLDQLESQNLMQMCQVFWSGH